MHVITLYCLSVTWKFEDKFWLEIREEKEVRFILWLLFTASSTSQKSECMQKGKIHRSNASAVCCWDVSEGPGSITYSSFNCLGALQKIVIANILSNVINFYQF